MQDHKDFDDLIVVEVFEVEQQQLKLDHYHSFFHLHDVLQHSIRR